jgi:hypothetical protein
MFFALVNRATYELLVAERGWTMDEWQDWVADLIEGDLFRSSGAAPDSA